MIPALLFVSRGKDSITPSMGQPGFLVPVFASVPHMACMLLAAPALLVLLCSFQDLPKL
jgi:hypothetical protein